MPAPATEGVGWTPTRRAADGTSTAPIKHLWVPDAPSANSTCPVEPWNLFSERPSNKLRRDATTVISMSAWEHARELKSLHATRDVHKSGTDLVTGPMLICFRDNASRARNFSAWQRDIEYSSQSADDGGSEHG